MDGWLDGRTVGWMDGRTDGRTVYRASHCIGSSQSSSTERRQSVSLAVSHKLHLWCTSRECSQSCSFPAVYGRRTRHCPSSLHWRRFLRWRHTTISSRSCWLKRCSTLDRQVTEVRLHQRLSSRRSTLATRPIQAYLQDMHYRLQMFAWNCLIVPHRLMYTGCGQPCSEPSMVCFQSRPHVSADKPNTIRSA